MKLAEQHHLKRLSLEWTRHLKTDQEKQNFENSLSGSSVCLYRLKDILEERVKDIHSSEMRESTYTDPSWAYKQAHLNGKLEGLTKVLELLSFLDKR